MDGFTASIWVEGRDGNGLICWRNRDTGVLVYADPERGGRGLADGPSPSAHQTCGNTTQHGGSDVAWEEYTDSKTKHNYWYNKVTNECTWKDPKTAGTNPPPPPPKKTEKTFEQREQDQWFKIDDPKKGKVWYHEKTKKTQKERPHFPRV